MIIKIRKGLNDTRTKWLEDEKEKDEMVEDHVTRGLSNKRTYDKRTRWLMAKMLEAEMAKDKMVEDEVA